MIDLLSFLKFRYLVLLFLIMTCAISSSYYLLQNQKDNYVSEILIRPVPLYDNIFMNYSLFDNIKFNLSKLNSSDLIDLVANKLKDNNKAIEISKKLNIFDNIIIFPQITYPRINPAEGIPEGSMILRVTSSKDDNLDKLLFSLVANAQLSSKAKIYSKFENYLEENEKLKNIELNKIKISIKKIVTLFENEIRDIQNEIKLSKELGFENPVISQTFAANGNNYMAGSIVLESRVNDIREAKENIIKLLDDLESKPVEQIVYQIVHEFVRYVDEHSAFSRVGGTGLTKDLINFKIYELIDNSIQIKQAIEILKRSEFDLVHFNESSLKTWNMKKSASSYYIFAFILSIFLTLLIVTIAEIYRQRKLPQPK